YRSSTGFTPLVVDVDELYDQFSYGIAQHPLAIRRFAKFAYDTFSLKPAYLLLLGKSLTNTRVRYTGFNNYATTQTNWKLNYVPTFGAPPADMLFTCFSQDTMPRQVFPVGRISARNNADVYAYLDKISAHENQLQQCPEEWQKRILHFGGGNTGAQQTQISNILSEFTGIAQDTLMGATVKTFLKTTTDPIQIDLSQYLQSLIDSGSALMTFVAHASGTSFDISTDIPQNYNNKDRYPLILANSCFVGDIHDAARRITEDFVLLPEKGSIGFVAQPDVGLLDNLQYYSKEFYSQMALHNYGNSVGKIMGAVVDSMLNLPIVTSNFNGYFIFKSVITGMTLSGDPAMVMHSFDRPDYSIENSSVFFTPSVITSDLDSFTVNVVLTNLGKATYNPFVLHFTRTYPDGTSTYELDTVINYVTYKDTISIRFPLDSRFSVGANSLSVYVDYLGNVDECNEANNTLLNLPLNIRSSDIAPVYPSEFAIVPNASGFKLKASTVDPFALPRNYKFQIDTVRSFNSPFLKQGLVYAGGGLVNWQPPFTLQPDIVYYWRVSRDSLPTDTIHPEWKQSSFIHKPSVTGWSQAHYSQFFKDEYTNVIYNERPDSTFRYVTSLSSLEVNNYQNISISYNPNFKINNVLVDYNVCTATPSMHIVVIDSLSLKAWSTRDHTFGEANRFDFNTNAPIPPCNGRGRPDFFFIFRMNDPASRDSMFNMLQNGIPTGIYLIAYTSIGGLFSTLNQQMKDLFTTWGSDSINFLNDTQAYIFFTKKGDTTFTQEAIGDASRPAIQIMATLGGNWSKGFVTSVPIGPSLGWSELHWDQQPLDAVAGEDSVYIDIIGITPGGNEVPLPAFSGISAGNYDVNISSIDATLYPKLKLRAYVQDDSLYTPPQLKRWQIYHQGVPEFALNPSKFFSVNKDSLQEGEEIEVKIAVENVGDVNAPDSLLMGYYVFDDARNRNELPYERYKPLSVGDTVVTSVRLNTRNYPGSNALWLEANIGPDQYEYYRFNNLAEIPFRVTRDIINPILDVTFDGAHIMNGDIVSSKPLIKIRLKDENPFLAVDDTSDWQIFLKNPAGISTKLAFESAACSGTGTAAMKWCPGGTQGNTFSIEYNPALMEDGIYELTAQATDATGNLSGSGSYKINFEVINKSTITEVVNYPNPFSTSTRFVFTLTGSEIPEDFRIQIMTVRGTVVREIGRDEIGPIRIGRNITEFAWNGKDEFGDQLANGVYLYRVLSRINGTGIEKRATEADKFFVKGWGKMYLMR
ncbi:MAG: C25 family cysteine peptidase, partial [Bacteroidia bacterium]